MWTNHFLAQMMKYKSNLIKSLIFTWEITLMLWGGEKICTHTLYTDKHVSIKSVDTM